MEFTKRTKEIVKDLRIIDDALFRIMCKDKKVCQEMLQTLLDDPELEVITASVQERITSFKREVVLDCLCRLSDGRYVNIEVQKDNHNDDIRRNRLHLSVITADNTSKGTLFEDVPEVVVIYISEYDALKNNQAVTLCEMCQLIGSEYMPLHDGARIYYANTGDSI